MCGYADDFSYDGYDYDGPEPDAEPVQIYFEKIIKESELAIYFLFDNEDILNPVKAWIPKSLIIKLDKQHTEIEIPDWLASEKGLI